MRKLPRTFCKLCAARHTETFHVRGGPTAGRRSRSEFVSLGLVDRTDALSPPRPGGRDGAMVDSTAGRLRFVGTIFAGRLMALAPLGHPDFFSDARVRCRLYAASAAARSGISSESFTFSHDKRRPPLSGRHAATRTGETDEPQPMA